MGKKKIGRSVKKNPNRSIESDAHVSGPHSFVIHKGLPGGHTVELTKDFRKIMEPFTASSLKVFHRFIKWTLSTINILFRFLGTEKEHNQRFCFHCWSVACYTSIHFFPN